MDETIRIMTRGPNVIGFNVVASNHLDELSTSKFSKSETNTLNVYTKGLFVFWGGAFREKVERLNIESNYVRASCCYSDCLVIYLLDVPTLESVLFVTYTCIESL